MLIHFALLFLVLHLHVSYCLLSCLYMVQITSVSLFIRLSISPVIFYTYISLTAPPALLFSFLFLSVSQSFLLITVYLIMRVIISILPLLKFHRVNTPSHYPAYFSPQLIFVPSSILSSPLSLITRPLKPPLTLTSTHTEPYFRLFFLHFRLSFLPFSLSFFLSLLFSAPFSISPLPSSSFFLYSLFLFFILFSFVSHFSLSFPYLLCLPP